MNASDIVIETTGLTKTYKGVQALKSLDLKVNRNSICGFLGPSVKNIKEGSNTRLVQRPFHGIGENPAIGWHRSVPIS